MRGAFAAMILALASCGGGDGLLVADGWARPNPEVTDRAAIYLSIVNEGATEGAVVGASSERCDAIEIHETVAAGDIVEMKRLDEIVLPAGRAVEMEPGGLHLMCVGVTEALVEGDAFSLDVELQSGSLLQTSVVVEDR